MNADDALLYAFRRNVVVAASAGTGKTHRLTALYVMLALGLTSMGEGHDDVLCPALPIDRIVATTFSRAAAQEIRGRVEHALTAIAEGASGFPFEDEIRARSARSGGRPSPGELRIAARHALDMWSRARIDTLHTTAFDIVRHAALVLGLPPSPRVAEEDEARELAQGVIDDTLESALGGGGARADAARALVATCSGLERTREVVLSFLSRLDDEGLPPSALATSDHLGEARELRAQLLRATRGLVDGGRDALAAAARELLLALGAPDDDLVPSADARGALDRLFEKRKPSKLSPDEAAFFAFRETIGGKTNLERARALGGIFAEAENLEARERGVLALVGEMATRLPSERTRRGVLGFGDILRLARDALRDHAEALSDVRREVRALLVDEFQDTSLVQRDLVYLLRERPASAASRAPGTMPTEADLESHGLFIVGDRKQSIYGFRGADVTVFSRTCAALAGEACVAALDLPAGLAGADPIADFVALVESRRSEPAIVEFVNAFSTADFASHEGDTDRDVPMRYGPGERLVSVRQDAGGRVELVRDDGVTAPDPLLIHAPAALREAFVAAAAAHRLHADGLAYGDIAILARRRATIPLVELALGRVGAPYVVAGRALYDTAEVRDAAALVRLVLDPSDRHALATILRGPMVALSDTALTMLLGTRGLDRRVLAERGPLELDRGAFPTEGRTVIVPDESTRLASFRQRFLASRAALLRLSPGEALRAAVRHFDFDRVLAALPRATARIGNLDRLVSIAAGRGGSLLAFSRWLDHQIADETDEREAVVFSPEDDAVRLTTIHASKGLDFAATIVLDLAAKALPEASPLVFLRSRGQGDPPRFVFLHRGEGGVDLPSAARAEARRVAASRAASERRRITYVAFTRAKHRLVLVAPEVAGHAGSALHTIDAQHDSALEDLLHDAPTSEWLEDALRTRPSPPPAVDVAPEPPPAIRSSARSLPIATTPLGVFRGCARRFRLRFLLGLEEPVDTGQLDLFEVGQAERRVEPLERDDVDPREAGRSAHRLLEVWPRERFGTTPVPGELEALVAGDDLAPTESARIVEAVRAVLASPFAAELAEAELHREEETRVVIAPSSEGDPSLELRGTIDLWARDSNGRISVVDYKLARRAPTLDAYAFQLRAYALALSRANDGAPVRTGVLFLLGDPRPVWLPGSDADGFLDASDHAAFEAELAVVAARLGEARATDVWPPEKKPECERLGCGFLTACHRKSASGAGKPRGRSRRVG